MEKLSQRIKPSSRHFKNSGEVTYRILPQKERISASLLPDSAKDTPEGLYISVRDKTISICKPLYVEDFVPKYGEFKTIKWHLAHSTWLFEKFLLKKFIKNYSPFHDKFDHFFEAMEEQGRGTDFSRPSLDSIISYRNYIDKQIRFLLNNYQEKFKSEIIYYLKFILGLEMDSQEEILTQVKARFFENDVNSIYWKASSDKSSKARTTLSPLKWVEFKGGLVNTGSAGKEFSCDIEMPRHTVYLRPFSMAQRVVTNGDYLQFINEGGYERGGLWLLEGWEEIQKNQKRMPKYWKRIGSAFKQYTMTGLKPLRLNEPVSHLSFYEADAYARFAKARLPSEAEWEHASESLQSTKGNFLGTGAFHPEPIIDEELRISGNLKGLFGNVWEWTTSLYAPYPGFVSLEKKLWKYTGRLEGSKRVLKGGSCLYDGTSFRLTKRKPLNLYQDEFCTGIRLVKNL